MQTTVLLSKDESNNLAKSYKSDLSQPTGPISMYTSSDWIKENKFKFANIMIIGAITYWYLVYFHYTEPPVFIESS